MNIFTVIEKSALVLNSILLVFLGVRYLQEVRRHRIEYEKLQLEIKALKRDTDTANQRIVLPSETELHKFVVEPILHRVEQIQKQTVSESRCVSGSELTAEYNRLASLLSETIAEFSRRQRDLFELREVLQELLRYWQMVNDGLKDGQFEIRLRSEASTDEGAWFSIRLR